MAGKFGFLSKFIFYFMILNVQCTEPHCSKFPYEEALLDKMIRMEVKVEEMEKRIKAAESNVVDELSTLEEERKSLKEVTTALKKDSDENKETLEKLISQYDEHLKESINNISVARDLNNGGRNGENEIIYFQARDVVDRTPSKNQVFVFPTELVNVGDGYDKKTGVFTAPVTGLYQFIVQVCLYPNKNLHFSIAVDDVNVQTMSVRDKDYYTSVATSAVRKLDAGSRAWVRAYKSCSGNTVYSNDDDEWTSFSGFLITRD